MRNEKHKEHSQSNSSLSKYQLKLHVNAGAHRRRTQLTRQSCAAAAAAALLVEHHSHAVARQRRIRGRHETVQMLGAQLRVDQRKATAHRAAALVADRLRDHVPRSAAVVVEAIAAHRLDEWRRRRGVAATATGVTVGVAGRAIGDVQPQLVVVVAMRHPDFVLAVQATADAVRIADELDGEQADLGVGVIAARLEGGDVDALRCSMVWVVGGGMRGLFDIEARKLCLCLT